MSKKISRIYFLYSWKYFFRINILKIYLLNIVIAPFSSLLRKNKIETFLQKMCRILVGWQDYFDQKVNLL